MYKTILAAAVATSLIGGAASAATFVLDFEGLQNQEAVNDFYNGGTGSLGSSGTNYGVEFSTNSLALIDQDAGGTGNFANEPSPDTILFFLSGGAATMNVAAGFDTGFSFFYSSTLTSFVNVYDGLDATGNLLATIDLPALPTGPGDPNGGANGVWDAVGVAFAGVAKSIDFGGTADRVGFDNVTFGSEIPEGPNEVPIPAALPLLAGALAAFGLIRRRA